MKVNVLILTKSVVDGTILKQALGHDPDLSITYQNYEEQQLLSLLNQNIHFDLILILELKISEDIKQRIQFIQNLFACPILLSASDPPSDCALPGVYFYPELRLKPTSGEFNKKIQDLIQTIKKISKNRNPLRENDRINTAYSADPSLTAIPKEPDFEIIAVGASTGGPQVLNSILANLPSELPVPIIVVQHMPNNFLPLFIEWLDKNSPLHVELATEGQKPQPGHVYFAPDNYHLAVNSARRFVLIDKPPLHNVKPSASYLFKSVAEVYGSKAIGILLTGMGKDGAKELALMKETGALTIAQDKESCIVFGMPKTAIELNAAVLILSPEQISEKIEKLFKLNNQLSGD